MFLQIAFIAKFSLSLLYSLLVDNIGAVNLLTTYAKMSLLSLIIEQSTVPCLIIIPKFLGDHFGVDKKKNGDHFGVGITSGSIWG